MCPNSDTPLSTHAHTLDSILKAGDHSTPPNPKGVILFFSHRISAIQEQAVLNFHCASARCNRTFTNFQVLVFDASSAALHLEAA